MMKPALPKGTRDFSPPEMARRLFLFGVLREAFETFGFLPLETPSMENLSTLTGKYGDEGDQLIFKILNSGDFFSAAGGKETLDSKTLLPLISEKALRYDLTVPFARFVVMNRHLITFPFRRFQIQPVWRADRPQKGRYREFYQCDADIIGTHSLLAEADLIMLADEVFSNLGLKVCMKLNNRKILSGLLEYHGLSEYLTPLCVAIDKLDKIGEEGVLQEIKNRIPIASAEALVKGLISLGNSSSFDHDYVNKVYALAGKHPMLDEGISEMSKLFSCAESAELRLLRIEFDPTLARGLNHYTGAILEIKCDEPDFSYSGSIGGGGRYDNLTGIFGVDGLSGVGLSFGADRIYDVMLERGLFPEGLESVTTALVINFGTATEVISLRVLRDLRREGISAEMYPDAAKMKKQLGYADALKIPFAVIIGEEEAAAGKVTIKNMLSGEQKTVDLEETGNTIQDWI
jgi:histidyl-tRNA synthetase